MRALRGASHEVYAVVRGLSDTHRHLRDRLLAIGMATLGVDLVCAVIAFFAERHAPQTEVKSFGSAIFWTSTQLLTVSSQLHNPITPGARVLDVFMEAYAITVVATLAGAFGSFFYRRGVERAGEPKRLQPAG
ncbi:MAG: hypothetical protein M3155_01725 [Actinomycetota bacterium]|nr:hypothetical protein [Actinomycetota bacterium]